MEEKNDKKTQENVASQLDNILKETEIEGQQSSSGEIVDNSELVQKFENETQEQKDKAGEKAKSTIISIAKLYFTEELLNSYPSIYEKMQIDIDSLAELLYQMDSISSVVEMMRRLIQLGEATQPRFFEVFTNSIKESKDLSVQKSEFISSVEHSYQKLRDEIKEQRELEGNYEINAVENYENQKRKIQVSSVKELAELIKEGDESSIKGRFKKLEKGKPRDPSVKSSENKQAPTEYVEEMKKRNEEERDDESYIESEIDDYFNKSSSEFTD